MIAILCSVFFLSGAAALLFETLWFHQAGLAFGNSVWASAIVLSSFMAGLALGNGLMARYGARLQRPIRFYALLEAAIAISGVALVYVLPLLSGWLAPFFRPFLDEPLILNPLRLGAGFALMLLPATAMGATLPVLVKVLLARDPNFGSVLGRLYGWNTLGAVIGAVAGELALVEWFGIRGTSWVAAALNGVAVVASLALSRRLGAGAEGAFAAAPATTTLSPAARRSLAAAFVAGATLLAFELVWFRFMHLFVHSGGLIFSLMLATVLAGIGLGGFTGAYWQRRDLDAFRYAPALALLSGILAVASYFGFTFVIGPFETVLIAEVSTVLWLSFVLMFPISLLSGVLFTFIGAALHQEVKPETRSAGLLTLANTLGGAVGSAAAGFVLLPVLGMERSFFALACTYGVVALLMWSVRSSEAGAPTLRPRLVGAVLFALALLLFPFGLMDNDYMRISIGRWDPNHNMKIAAVREGRLETIVYLRKELDGEPMAYQLLTDGFSMSATIAFGRRYQRLYVFWPVALRPDPKRALVISCGAGSTAKGLVETRSLEHIDVVDISKAILELSDVVYPDPKEHPLNDPRVHVHIEDGRYFLQTTDERYDIITADPPPPKNAGVVNLYTREYFQLMHDRLNEGGIATYWLPVHNTTLSDTQAIIRGFCDVFEDCSLWRGFDVDWMMAGSRNAKWERSTEDFVRQWQNPELAGELRAIGIERPEQLGAMFMADAAQIRELVGDTPPLTDNHPKRLSNERNTPQLARRLYRPWMDSEITRERFESSEFIAQAWPEEMREKSLDYFEFQHLINDMGRNHFLSMREWVERIHVVLTESDLQTLVIWQLGETSDEQDAIDRLIRRGKPAARYRVSLARRAFSKRNYDLAARLLAVPPGAGIPDPKAFYLRLYALCMAGKVEEAATIARESARWLAADKDARDYFDWLNETFGFEAPALVAVATPGGVPEAASRSRTPGP